MYIFSHVTIEKMSSQRELVEEARERERRKKIQQMKRYSLQRCYITAGWP
jgi:hypothetical protein